MISHAGKIGEFTVVYAGEGGTIKKTDSRGKS